MKNIKGITLMTLVITIIVLLILTSVVTYSGISVISSSKLISFTTQMKIMQTHVNSIYEEMKSQTDNGEALNMGVAIEGAQQTQADKVFTSSESGIASYEGYRYWSKEYIKSLGIEGVDEDFFVNLNTRSIVSYNGIEDDGKKYYTLSQLPEGLYNVEYENVVDNLPTFQITTEKIGINKWKIIISDIEYSGYISKWEVQYKLEGQETWNTSDNLNFTVNNTGTYIIKLVNGEVQSEEQSISVK